jgi:hypothetical protein
MLTFAELLRECREQRPRNKDDVDSSLTEEVDRVYYTGEELLLITFFTTEGDYVPVCFKSFNPY